MGTPVGLKPATSQSRDNTQPLSSNSIVEVTNLYDTLAKRIREINTPMIGIGEHLHQVNREIKIILILKKRAATLDFQQSGILTSVISDEYAQSPFKLRNYK